MRKTKETLLEIKDLKLSYYSENGKNTILEGFNLTLLEDEVVALVGASGCGKSSAALSILMLLGSNARIEKGEVLYKGRDLVKARPEYMAKIRGEEISIIFQEPLSALNPVFTIGYQMYEVFRYHSDLGKEKIYGKMVELLKLVGIAGAKEVIKYYPHQLSGGMRQRIVIAMSIALNPKLIIADEPTSNLDVTLQVQIIDLFKKLKEELGVSILLITHDLRAVEDIVTKINVMHKGRVIEENITQIILRRPKEDYTKLLIKAADYQ